MYDELKKQTFFEAAVAFAEAALSVGTPDEVTDEEGEGLLALFIASYENMVDTAEEKPGGETTG